MFSHVIRYLAVKHSPQELFDPYRSLIVSIFAQFVVPSVGPTTISPIQTKSIAIKPRNLLFWHDKRERNDTTTDFSTVTPIPSSNELSPITVSTFIARNFENTLLTNHVSTSANLDPMISSAFVEVNYEVLESLLRKQMRQKRNEYLRTELEYCSEEYNKEREMEPRPVPSKRSLQRRTSWYTTLSGEKVKALKPSSPGGEPFNTEHRLNGFKHIEPIKQKKRSLAPERNEAMRKKVEELTKANILREVKYQTWVSNPVMVKKDDRRWKLC
uniref:Putative reverse transcriptase domain-containing protein n=1 Tax=Tanacetum cinerariifolium TaxID=118510 RepID=A0A6L2M6Q7_TANCI|nr:putative reverse transcriptase domain-containing protein [Tanacetum cinerariifolium]